METKRDCNSNPSSDARDEAPKKTPNAFTPEFLKKLQDREDAPLAALEAESRGPWKIVHLPLAAAGGGDGGDGGGGKPHRDAERWAVLRTWEDASKDAPSATCKSREVALLWAAALEVASRGSDLAVGARRDEHGQVIEEWIPESGSHVVGHFAVSDPDVVAAMRVLSSLLRIPEALARVVDAGSAPIAELIGRRLVSG